MSRPRTLRQWGDLGVRVVATALLLGVIAYADGRALARRWRRSGAA